jgi:glycerophosphoryl diester phosphodiesterase
MKITKYLFFILLAFISVLLWYFFFYIPEYDWRIDIANKPYVFSHRWFGIYWPDNSLSGAISALENGYYGIDVDGQFTKDGKVVIYHDLSVNRLTSASGKVRNMTLDELIRLDLGEKFNPWEANSWSWAMVHSFEDFVKEIPSKWILMVELKIPGIHDTGMEAEVARIITKYKAEKLVYISSFNPIVLYRLKKLNPSILRVMISMDTNWNAELLAEIPEDDRVDLPWILRQEWIRVGIRKIVQPDALSINHETKESTIDKLISRRYPVFLWTIDDKERIEWAKQKSPHSIITDDPKNASLYLE